MPSSIRRTLFAWYACILAVVIGGLGTVLYVRLRDAALDELDSELTAHAQAISAALNPAGEGGYKIELAEGYLKRFARGGTGDPYYALWNAGGELVEQSDESLELPVPQGDGVRDRPARRPPRRERGTLREVMLVGEDGSVVLVGQDTGKELRQLRSFMLTVALSCGGAYLVSLAGGWWLVTRALRPIARISAAATAISATNLSQRINLETTESELGRLAGTLNDAFDRLQAVIERQRQFTADASHELRTPLTVLLSHVELALRRPRGADEYREALGYCLHAGQRMHHLVNDLLTLARADAEGLPLRRQTIDLRMLADDAARLLAAPAAERNVRVTIEGEAEVWADPERLHEVLTNLIGNAINHNRPGGDVEVRVSSPGDLVELAVSDTGPGIPLADQPRVFERFFRVDKARDRQQGGAGLGLAITRAIVEAHGGSISLTSQEGQGATFTVRLPRQAA